MVGELMRRMTVSSFLAKRWIQTVVFPNHNKWTSIVEIKSEQITLCAITALGKGKFPEEPDLVRLKAAKIDPRKIRLDRNI